MNSKQPGLFSIANRGDGRETIYPISAPAQDGPRLSSQSRIILDALRLLGPGEFIPKHRIREVTGSLAETARISDCRRYLQATTGETIVCRRGEGGATWYRIEKETRQ